MAAGETEAAAELPPPPPLPPPPGGAGTERALEEAAASGTLSLAGRRLRTFPAAAARRWDLSDTTQADLSRNRFAEVPEDACRLVSLEGLSLYHNCLRSIPPTIANLQALTYLNLSRNQLAALPTCLCRLPLRVLIASNNKLPLLPDDIGALSGLRQLDVSCNELQSLPASVGQLESLRDLNVRRNQLTALPEELSELPLVRLDFSCNRVAAIPVCYRHLRHLQTILSDNNPLRSPPAQVCLKGKVHIFKYLNVEACSKAAPELAEFARAARPSSFGTCLADEFYPVRQYGGLDSGFNSVDSGSKRWSGNESADEFSDLSLRIAELAREPRQLKEKRPGAAGDSDLEQVDFIDGSVNGEEEEEAARSDASSQGPAPPEEKRRPEKSPSSPRAEAGEKAASGRAAPGSIQAREEAAGEERRRPETLQLWQERERQQQALRSQSLEKRDSFLRTAPRAGPAAATAPTNGQPETSTFLQRRLRTQGAELPAGPLRPASPRPAARQQESPPAAGGSSPRDPGAAPKPNSFLFRSASRGAVRAGSASPQDAADPPRLRAAPAPDADDKELVAEMRKSIEGLLQLSLGEDLGEALADGAVLCQLANRLRPRAVPFIHVPSPAVPKLSAVKSRKNVESFLEACRRMGVPEVALCSPGDVLRGRLGRLGPTLRALPPPAGPRPPPPTSLASPSSMSSSCRCFTWLIALPASSEEPPPGAGRPRLNPRRGEAGAAPPPLLLILNYCYYYYYYY
ncbi:LOW QUALITY PROTEIN: leucine-rich repeat and calponin homology domain-containing protein 4-like [Struthio camelus]|uniref:LOW QUALITY PROTEIN: leucine-rich repeat and calponin homology domain-containing protein 4-like n=1 Tax=Struthio camelus TaxID=8801 RepID=UPI003603D2FB